MTYQFSGKANHICAQLYDAFTDTGIDVDKIASYQDYHNAMIKAGMHLDNGRRGQIYKDFCGKVAFPLFADYLVNCELFTDSLGIHNMISEWDLPGDDHGVDATAHLVNDDNDLVTEQLKWKANRTASIDRNDDHAGNFYEASVEEYRVTDRGRMIWITPVYNFNKNLKEYTRRIDGHRIDSLTDRKKKIFWAPFWQAVETASSNARILRPAFGQTTKVYAPCQESFFSEVLSTDYDMQVISAGCGAAKGDAIGKKMEQVFKDKPGSIVAVEAARLQLLGELSTRFHKNFSSQPYAEATFSSRRDWQKDSVIAGESANNKVFASTNPNAWVAWLEENVAPFLSQNLLIWVCYASYENFAKMLKYIEQEHPILWDQIGPRLQFEARDEVHNLTSNEKTLESDPKEDRRMKRVLTQSIPFMNRVFAQNCGFSATVPDFVYDHSELFGPVIAGPDQATLQAQGVTVPLTPIVIVSSDEDQNQNLSDDDKDFTYFDKAFTEETKYCAQTGMIPKVIIWSRHAYTSGYYEAEFRKKYPNALVGSMTAATPYKTRADFFDKFVNSTVPAILINYDIVSEGTDIDGATAVIIGRGLGQIKLTQIGGRPIRMFGVDRVALNEGKIKPLDPTGWIKPEGRAYFYEEEDSLASTETVSESVQYLLKLQEGGLIDIKNAKFLKKPINPKPPESAGVMDDPEETVIEFQQKFFDILKKNEYRVQIKQDLKLIGSQTKTDNFLSNLGIL
jgi:hypothetical protein